MSDKNKTTNDNTVTLDQPIKRDKQDITHLEIRKPNAGEMRGVSLVDLLQLDVDAIIKILPRITLPALSTTEVQTMDLADLTACGGKIAGFLAQKSLKEQYQ